MTRSTGPAVVLRPNGSPPRCALHCGAPRDFGERSAGVDDRLQQILAAAIAGGRGPGALSLVGAVLDVLRTRGIEHGLIGVVAMAAYGVIRATLDTDILVVDGAVLGGVVWKGALPAEADVEIRADLILLKLYAGGPQDRLDIQLLLDRAEGAVAAVVEERISSAPSVVRKTWTALRGASEN